MDPDHSSVSELQKVPYHSADDNTQGILNSSSTLADDGNLEAWLHCIGAFILFFNSWGITNTFGTYQTLYENDLLRTKSASNISWIGSLQSFLLIFGGLFTGPLFDAGHLKPLIWMGSFLIVFGMIMTSLCSSYWQLVLAQGILIGLGCACFFVPSVAVIPLYFAKRRALAMGVAAAGSSIGGIIYPIILHRLEPQLGLPWATRILAFIALGTLAVPLARMRMPPRPKKPARRGLDAAAWKEGPFICFALSAFFGFVGLYIPFFYMQTYAMELEIVDQNLAFYLLPLLNAGSFFGRIIPNYIADKAGPLNTILVCTGMTSILGFVWIGVTSTASIVIFCLLYGFFSGAFVSLGPAVIARLCTDMKVFGARLGMLFLPASAGLLIGNPIAGAILRSGWVGLQVFCGTIMAAALLCTIAARVIKVGASPMAVI